VVRGAIVVAAVLGGLFFLPFALPILPEKPMVAYSVFVGRVLHISRSTMATERFRRSALPEDWADMHGWPELAAAVALIYNALPPGERAQAAIVTSNYGEAAAIDFFGTAYGLPPAISGHNNYWLWGTHGFTGNVVIDVNGDCGQTRFPGLFKHTRLVTRFNPPWVISYEQDIPISLCTGITQPLATIWPRLRIYI
jgi:hypothetical protein